ncbi:hypothetical protein EC968_007959 [Mortierella alpina]|nr:hypothetical protein EC968_007959 [Mortierella alpina]
MYLLLLDAPEAMAWTATNYFLETSPVHDAALRRTWIRTLLETHDLEDASRAQALSADHILGLLSEGPLIPRLAHLKDSLATRLSLDSHLLDSKVNFQLPLSSF